MMKTELKNTQDLNDALGELDELTKADKVDVGRLEKLYAAVRMYNVRKHLLSLIGSPKN